MSPAKFNVRRLDSPAPRRVLGTGIGMRLEEALKVTMDVIGPNFLLYTYNFLHSCESLTMHECCAKSISRYRCFIIVPLICGILGP